MLSTDAISGKYIYYTWTAYKHMLDTILQDFISGRNYVTDLVNVKNNNIFTSQFIISSKIAFIQPFFNRFRKANLQFSHLNSCRSEEHFWKNVSCRCITLDRFASDMNSYICVLYITMEM